VLTLEGLSVIVEAIRIARCIFLRMKNFINYRIACTLQLVVFFFIAIFALHPSAYGHEAHFFKMPVLMLILITVLNDGTLISVAYDHVIPSHQPEKWNLKVLWTVSIVLAAIACLSSLLLLWAALQSHPSQYQGSVFHGFGLPSIPYPEIITMIYLKVSISDFLTLFSARTHNGFFWSDRPSPFLLGAAVCSLAISTIVACFWGEGVIDGIEVRGLVKGSYTLWPLWVWIYCVVWWFIQDACKVLTYMLLRKFNVFHINTTQMVNVRGAATFNENPLARQSAGAVESKLAEMKVEKALDSVNRVARRSNEPGLRRVSQDLTLVRNSIKLARASMGSTGKAAAAAADVEGGVPNADAELARIQQTIAQMERAVAAAPPEDRAEIQKTLDELRVAADKMAAVNKLAQGEITK
jgi:H+-transporting ATPase